MAEFSVLVIGAGKIGAFFDSPSDEAVLSHAHAFSKHPGFRMLGFVDVDLAKAREAACIWGGDACESIDGAFEHHIVDVAVVAVPDELHSSTLKKLATYPIRCVFTEKPLAITLLEAEEVSTLYREKNIPLALNYIRRFVPEFMDLRGRIASGEFGQFLGGTGYYGKGTLHNGSHLIDLLRFMLGEITSVTHLGCIHDWSMNDPTCSAVLGLSGGGQVIVQAVDCRNFTLFELDLLFGRKRIRIVDSGFAIELCDIEESSLFAGYSVLSRPIKQGTGLPSALFAAAEAIYACLTEAKPLPCEADDGVRAIEICTRMIGGQ